MEKEDCEKCGCIDIEMCELCKDMENFCDEYAEQVDSEGIESEGIK